MRRGITDLHRRAEIPRQSTARYLDALASVDPNTTLAHGLICKVTGTHRYQVTASGRTVITAVLTALRATVRRLPHIAA